MKQINGLFFLLILAFLHCNSQSVEKEEIKHGAKQEHEIIDTNFSTTFDKNTKTIHILVALCDNENQGIVRVPKIIGNGQDPKNNLYWGAAYGIKTFFKKSTEWQLVQTQKVDDIILERLVFKHKKNDFYIVADAYDGRYIKTTTEIFLRSSAGINKDVLSVGEKTIGIEGNSKMVAYIGHDGLMDFQLHERFENTDGHQRDVIVLACTSQSYFEPHLKSANTNPIVMTTGLMAPEAYTIHDAITGYVNGETNEQIRQRAAKAYAKYQKCGVNAAMNLLVTGEE